MNRRDFLKLSPLAFAPIFKGGKNWLQTEYNIVSVFSNVQDGDVINIPPGLHMPADTLSLHNKRRVTIYANNAQIYPYGSFTGKPVLDMAGASQCKIHGLYIQSHETPNPISAILLGRTAQNGGGCNSFYDMALEGYYSMADIYNVCSEGNSFINCFTQTEGSNPIVVSSIYNALGLDLVESSNCSMYFDKCSFRNYGNASVLFRAEEAKDLKIRDSFIYLGTNGTFIQASGDTNWLTLHDLRVEGSNGLLLDNISGTALKGLSVQRVNWTLQSPMIKGMMYL